MLSVEELVEYRKDYFTRKKQAAYSRAYWKNHPEKLKAKNAAKKRSPAGSTTRWKNRAPEMYMLSAAKHRAKRDGLVFTLEVHDIVIPTVCPVLGIPIAFSTGREKGSSPSLDRVDNTKGYTAENVRVISNRANLLKRDGTEEEHRAIADYIAREKTCK